jgi:cobalt-zinc-cadmium resistance protein CzcA
VSPTGELIRYTLSSPKDALGRDIYTLNDLKALQDWTLERQLRRVPRIIDVVGFGGTVKRYEVHPDPDRLKMYGITLAQLQNAIASSNANVGGDYIFQGPAVLNVRGIGLIGGGQDPMQAREVLGAGEPEGLGAGLLAACGWAPAAGFPGSLPWASLYRVFQVPESSSVDARTAALRATAYLREEERRRLNQIRKIVITAVNNVPIRVENVVEGGPLRYADEIGVQGVVVGHQTRLGKVGISRRRHDNAGRALHDLSGRPIWDDEDEKVQAIVMLRKGEDALPALHDVKEKIHEVNERPGYLLPGVKLQPHFDLTGLIDVTTETVRENLALGMGLVTVILLMFLNNIRSAMIVAINIPLALLFAFGVLFLRGRSANLLSIGAVDFGIIVDSSVIMVENIYRHLSAGEQAELPIQERIILACREVERSLFFSTVIMVCALLPLFTMQGPEGQIFGPMADTYAFALVGALFLALTLSPVLCRLFFQNLKPARDNFLVRGLKAGYLSNLRFCLKHRLLALGACAALLVATLLVLPFLGREFMPELEEGNLYIRGTFPVNIALDEAAAMTRRARAIMRGYPEVELVASQVGRPDDGTDPAGFYNVEFTVPLRPQSDWPAVKERKAWWARLASARPRTKPELVEEMSGALRQTLIGVDWNFSQYIRDNVMESLSGVKGDNSVKIIGPDLDELERLADQVKNTLLGVRGIVDVGVFRIKGQPNLEFPIDRDKCSYWGISVADVQNVIQSAVGGKPITQMTEGEKTFDIALRWPARLRSDEQAILDLPVDVTNNLVTPGLVPSMAQTPLTGPSVGVSTSGTSALMPSALGSPLGANMNNLRAAPRRRLGDLISPLDNQGRPLPNAHFIRPGSSTIYREQGSRLIAVKFSVRDRDLAGAVADAQAKAAPLFQAPYRAEWSGEFQEMEEAERRLVLVVSLALGLILFLLYLAFESLLDAAVVLSNVVAVSVGGVWALLLTGTNFNISAAVGFISILGVAIMNGLLIVSSFNALRARGVQLRDAITQGMEKLVRPVTMTALAAIFGLLPAALSTRIGSQSQRPLAIAVVGGMIMTLLLTNLVPLLYSFYGQRQPRHVVGMQH